MAGHVIQIWREYLRSRTPVNDLREPVFVWANLVLRTRNLPNGPKAVVNCERALPYRDCGRKNLLQSKRQAKIKSSSVSPPVMPSKMIDPNGKAPKEIAASVP